VSKNFLSTWRANFLAGLAITLPAIVSIAVVVWLFSSVSNITDTLLIFLPREITHEPGINGPGTGMPHWYWSAVALLMALILISVVGLLARNYVGKTLIKWVDVSLGRLPLVNKIYGATKQINEAFTSGNKTSFKTVVMIEFPRPGAYSVGFLTGSEPRELGAHIREKLVGVFIPTTPNPTSGFLVLVPADQVTKLDMSVADGIKFIVSLGALMPESIAVEKALPRQAPP
jgi:uncharacterized membrane protein